MATFDVLADRYAEELEAAIHRERISRAAGLIKEGRYYAHGHFAQALGSLSKRLNNLQYASTDEPLSEEDKQDIVGRIADRLQVDRSRLKHVLKEASIDNALQVVDEIEQIIDDAK